MLFLVLLFGIAVWEIWRALTAVDRAARKALRNIEQTKHVTAYDVTIRFCDREVIMESEISDGPRSLPYSGFKRLVRGKELILIRTESTLVYSLDPASFVKGTEADFWKLMNEKCPRAVPKALRDPAAGA